jgi:Transglutaminase-like superfamily
MRKLAKVELTLPMKLGSQAVNGFRQFQRVFSIPCAEHMLFLEAALFLILVRAAFSLLRFCTVWKWLVAGISVNHVQPQSAAIQACIPQAVSRAARYVPCTTCLTQSLAGVLMLGRRGYPAFLCVGVARDGNELRAHAWVERNGAAVIGAKRLFTTILIVPGASS